MYNVSKTTDETEFFEKVKKYLGSPSLYADFLKCLSLFSRHANYRLDQHGSWIHWGNDELFLLVQAIHQLQGQWYEATWASLGTSGPRSNRSGNAGSFAEAQVPELNLSALKRVGCYRIYPVATAFVKLPVRTVLCDEVLNDELVSCAVLKVKIPGFLSSKKNQYEDALFKCEDERFEMDLILEYNLSTIAVLEPIAKNWENDPGGTGCFQAWSSPEWN